MSLTSQNDSKNLILRRNRVPDQEVRSGMRPLIVVAIISLIAYSCTGEPTLPVHATVHSSQVAGVQLVEVGTDIRNYCQIAANQLGRPVPCPSLLPAHPIVPNTELCTGRDQRLGGPGCFRAGAFLMQEVFRGPVTYIGIADTDGSTSNIGHLNIWSSPEGHVHAAGLGCVDRGRMVGTAEVLGHSAVWITCPENTNPPQDSGHIMLQWTEDGTVYAVTLHTDTQVNRELAVAIARNLELVTDR